MTRFPSVFGMFAGLIDDALAWFDDVLDRPRRKGRRRAKRRDGAVAALLLAPAMLILGAFGVFPLFYAVYMSGFGGKYGRGPFVGLSNYKEALTTSPFWNSFLVTIYYAIGTIPTTMAISFVIAYGLFSVVRGRGVLRTVYFLPYVTSAVAAAMIWRAFLNPQGGVANALLLKVGLPPQEWLLEARGVLHVLTGGAVPASLGPSVALCCIILFEVWHSCGFMIVVFLAGLTTIPRELDEAARIDGAGTFYVIRNVTLPLLSPTIFFLAIISVIKAFQAFNSFYALAGDRPGLVYGTQNMTMYIYSSFYESQRLGYGSAVATLLCLTIVGLTLVQWRFAGTRVHYE